MTKENGFRVFGEVLDRDESYVDVDVDGVDPEGNVYLVEQGDKGEAWTVPIEKIGEYHDALLLVGLGDLPFPNHQIWKDLEGVGDTRATIEINKFVDGYLKDGQENIFKAIVEAGR
jgi:hypothetical protein